MQIVGAGLAGLIAANVFPQARIIEAQGREKLPHNALLRFRSTAVADVTRIEFRKVQVNKGIWHLGRNEQPSIRLANLYSQKVIGKLADRSIWNLAPSERYIAPEDFISKLINNAEHRIEWNTPFRWQDHHESDFQPVISTMPMSVLASIDQTFKGEVPKFEFKSIFVSRFRVHNADVFQTIYFTDPDIGVYRASISGDLMIVESVSELLSSELGCVMEAFGIYQIDPIESCKQRFGKIAPIDDVWRRNFILRASTNHNIYSVGRFATWRNILLDDVVHDLSVVKRLIKLGGGYHNRIKS